MFRIIGIDVHDGLESVFRMEWNTQFHQNRIISWLTSIPRSWRRSSTGRGDSGKRTYIITAKRMIAYVERRKADGLSGRDIIRCLKRFVAREVYQLLPEPSSSLEPANLPSDQT